MPPKTRGWRARVLLSVARVGEGRGEGAVGHGCSWGPTGKEGPGEGGPKVAREAVRPDAFTRAGHPRTGNGASCRHSFEHVGREDAAGRLLHEDGGGGALGPAGLGGVDGHVVVQRREDRADERVGGLRLRRELGNGRPRTEVDPDGHPDHPVVLAQPGHGEGDLVVLGGQARESGQALARGPTPRAELDVDDHGLRLGLVDGLCVECAAFHADRPLSLAWGEICLIPSATKPTTLAVSYAVSATTSAEVACVGRVPDTGAAALALSATTGALRRCRSVRPRRPRCRAPRGSHVRGCAVVATRSGRQAETQTTVTTSTQKGDAAPDPSTVEVTKTNTKTEEFVVDSI